MASEKRPLEPIEGRHYLGILLLSLATLLLELALTRVLSVALWYHFGFLVISTALLGFGSAGAVLSVWPALRIHAPLDRTLAWLSVAFGLVTVASFWAMQHIPFDPFRLMADPVQILLMPLFYVVLSAPFFCSGLGIALLLTRGSREVNRLYATDLAGAAVGCAAVALTMRAFGGSGSVVAAAAIGLFAASAFGYRQASQLAVWAAVLGGAVAAFTPFAERAIPIRVASDKRHPLKESGSQPVYTAWNVFSRVDVYELPARPDEGWPIPGLGIVIDGGGAGTGIGDLRGGVTALLANPSLYRAPGVAFVGKQNPNVLVIGSGAGREVLEALAFGASSITAVEVNSIVNDIVTRRFRDRMGGLFDRPEVRVITDEGRNFVRQSGETYDAIVAIQTMSNAAAASGALGLTESYMFTKEAFEDFLDHLAPDGILLVTRPATQLARFAATVREVLQQRGIPDAGQHIVAFRSALAPFGPRQNHDGLLFKKSPFTQTEVASIRERLATRSVGIAKFGTPEILHSPLDPRPGNLIHDVLAAADLQRLYREHELELRPSTDDWPFFNSQMRWSSLGLRHLPYAFGLGGGHLSEHWVAVVLLIALLCQSSIIAAALVLFPLVRFARQGLRIPGRWNYLAYFAALGLGFIMLEIVLLQRFTLFLGEPVYTFAVILASLLLFTGAGSFAAERFGPATPRLAAVIVGAVIITIAVTILALPSVFSASLGLPLAWRVTIAVAVVAPNGFLLGMPFPVGLRLLHGNAPALVPWAWGVNGFFTVIGSVLAMLVGMAAGFTVTSAAAACCYGIALLSLRGHHIQA
jgi:spermidine synthase